MPEALETWPIDLLQSILPRVYMIIEEIDRRYRESLPADVTPEQRQNTAILWGGQAKMANLSIISSFSVNGVASLHTDILKSDTLRDFYALFPEKFNNKTNGISHRRFLIESNPGLSNLITSAIGRTWIFNPDHLSDLLVKRIHAYKRQLLFAFKIMDLYNQLKEDPTLDIEPQTFIFAGKAAGSYAFAKESIKLINSIADVVNHDPVISKIMKVVFIENFCVSNAQLIYPAAEISEQISTAGKEASGTGNMKFMLNGAITLGTMDGANVEIHSLVGDDNIRIFGMNADEAATLRASGNYFPMDLIHQDPRLRHITDQLINGFFHKSGSDFWGIRDALLNYGDEFFVLKDFDDYVKTWNELIQFYRDRTAWNQVSLHNIAKSGFFSSDRTISEYANEIWNVHCDKRL